MSAKKIIELRNLLEEEIEKAFRKSSTPDTKGIISKFKSTRVIGDSVVIDLLLDIALIKLVGDIRQRKKHSLLTESQQTLFADFVGVRQSFVLKNSKGQKIEKTIAAMTIGELEEWLHREAKAVTRLEKNANEAHLLNYAAKFADSKDTSIEEALRNAKAGRKPFKKSA
jgi:hypothetical protein